MVTVDFVQGQDRAIAALVPAERAHVGELMRQGLIEAVHVAADGSRAWLVMRAESPDVVRQAMTSFPLYPYMVLDVVPLMEPPGS
jgi:muconolactone delta-isomerase